MILLISAYHVMEAADHIVPCESCSAAPVPAAGMLAKAGCHTPLLAASLPQHRMQSACQAPPPLGRSAASAIRARTRRALTRAHARAGGPADGYHCIVGAPTA